MYMLFITADRRAVRCWSCGTKRLAMNKVNEFTGVGKIQWMLMQDGLHEDGVSGETWFDELGSVYMGHL